MKKIELMLLIVLLSIFSVGCSVFSFDNKFAEIYQSDTQIGISSPEVTLEEFWKAALKRDEEKLSGIMSPVNVNLFSECDKENASSESQSNTQNELLEIGDKRKDDYSKKPILPPSSRNISNSIDIFATYIYANKISYSRVKILNKKTFNDETLLVIGVADNNNDFANGEKFAFAFKEINNGWKLSTVVQLEIFNFVDENIKYGSPQKCS